MSMPKKHGEANKKPVRIAGAKHPSAARSHPGRAALLSDGDRDKGRAARHSDLHTAEQDPSWATGGGLTCRCGRKGIQGTGRCAMLT